MADKTGKLWIGTSGFQYDYWQGVFYPQEILKKDWFRFYAEHFPTVEINNTFYHLPEADTFEHWRMQSRDDFLYALKFSRYGSHLKRLKDPQDTIGRFVERARRLQGCLGPILVQLPPRWHVNPERLDAFLESAPSDLQWTLEFRDPSWLCEEVFEILSRHGAALCIHDMLEDHPQRVTANWIYLRFHGDRYKGRYTLEFLTSEADRIREYLDEGYDVFAYFNNDESGYAVQNALELKRYLENG